MGQNAQTDRPRRGYVTIDWLVVAVAGIALLFLMGTLLRTAVDAEVIASGNFNELDSDDTLLAFQDFSFEATGWAPSATSDRMPGIGPVLGPFQTEAVQRSFAMPADAALARISFDLHLVGDWAGPGGFHVSLDDTEVLRINLPSDAELGAVEAYTVDDDDIIIVVESSSVTPRRADETLAVDAADFVSVNVQILVLEPSDTLALRLLSDVGGGAEWTLDNFTVVATSNDTPS